MFDYKSNFDETKKRIAVVKIKALEAVGIFIAGETKTRAPVDTGRLKGSYTHGVDAKNDKVTIGSNVEYAIYVEKGTYKSKAQPHLTPAVEQNIRRIENLVKENLKI